MPSLVLCKRGSFYQLDFGLSEGRRVAAWQEGPTKSMSRMTKIQKPVRGETVEEAYRTVGWIEFHCVRVLQKSRVRVLQEREDAAEALEEQQRSRLLHVRWEAKAWIRDAEGEAWEGLDQALWRLLSLPQTLHRSSLLPEGPCLLQGMHPWMLVGPKERHPKVSFIVSASSI